MVSELERAGFEAGAAFRDPDEITAIVHLATGIVVDRLIAAPGSTL